jgi:dTDP-glucose pyrophosphorylase
MTMNRNFVGVILAAGKGSRLAPLNISYAKPLIPICNKPIMQYQIELMREHGIRDIIVVVSHLKKQVMRYFGDGSRLGVRIRYVEQGQTLGIAHAVGLLEKYIKSPFLLFLGDIFFVPKDFSQIFKLFADGRTSAVLAVKEEKDPSAIERNFAILLRGKGSNIVKRVIEKPRYVVNRLKGCGAYLFDLSIFDAIRQTPRTAMRDEYEITTSVQILINEGHLVRIAKVVEWDKNITFASDILHCNRQELDLLKMKNCISASAQIHRGARITNSVIGAGVKITCPIRVNNCVIFDNIRVSCARDLDNSILTPKIRLRCDERAG